MNIKKLSTRFWVVTLMVVAAAFIRLVPHPPNFTPIAAMALFGGAYFTRKWAAFVIPLAALFVTDMIIGFHGFMIAVYISFALVVVIGMLALKKVKVKNVLLASVSASVLFFVITNFAVWIGSPFYPQTALGLIESYTLAIPFFWNTLLGDLLFTAAIFGAYELLRVKVPVLAEVKN